jgi:hypothetical protein
LQVSGLGPNFGQLEGREAGGRLRDPHSNLLATCELAGGEFPTELGVERLTTENVLEVPITLLELRAVTTHPPLLQSDISR